MTDATTSLLSARHTELCAWRFGMTSQCDCGLDDPALPRCEPRRYGKQGVLRCPHGCVTQCQRDRRKAA